MLRQRVITALLMAGAFLAGVYWLPPGVLGAVFAFIVALGAWEWAPMAGLVSARTRVLYMALLVAGVAIAFTYTDFGLALERERLQPLLGLACLWWCFALLWVKSFPGSARLWGNRFIRCVMGFLVLVPAWLAAFYLLHMERHGAVMVVLILIVAAADIGAYFSGKAFGRHALSPAVSPGKTWEGFWGGVACVALLAMVVWSLLPDRYDHVGLPAAVVVALVTAFASVLGDLTVSMVKRVSGVKDSSSLLPGHGGLLDRLDSICAAAPTFALSLILAGV